MLAFVDFEKDVAPMANQQKINASKASIHITNACEVNVVFAFEIVSRFLQRSGDALLLLLLTCLAFGGVRPFVCEQRPLLGKCRVAPFVIASKGSITVMDSVVCHQIAHIRERCVTPFMIAFKRSFPGVNSFVVNQMTRSSKRHIAPFMIAFKGSFPGMNSFVCDQMTRLCKRRMTPLVITRVWLYAAMNSFVYDQIAQLGKRCIAPFVITRVRLFTCVNSFVFYQITRVGKRCIAPRVIAFKRFLAGVTSLVWPLAGVVRLCHFLPFYSCFITFKPTSGPTTYVRPDHPSEARPTTSGPTIHVGSDNPRRVRQSTRSHPRQTRHTRRKSSALRSRCVTKTRELWGLNENVLALSAFRLIGCIEPFLKNRVNLSSDHVWAFRFNINNENFLTTTYR